MIVRPNRIGDGWEVLSDGDDYVAGFRFRRDAIQFAKGRCHGSAEIVKVEPGLADLIGQHIAGRGGTCNGECGGDCCATGQHAEGF